MLAQSLAVWIAARSEVSVISPGCACRVLLGTTVPSDFYQCEFLSQSRQEKKNVPS